MKKHITINVMGQLLVGDPMNPDSAASKEARAKFRLHLKEMKRLGVQGVSIDFWWGLIQPEEGPIDWTKPGAAYYDWIVNEIIAHGLKVVPILSFHQCGGNVGDDVFVPIPKWVWEKLRRLLGDENFAKFVSEQGNACDEYVSFWATHLILADYLAFVQSFRDHFADRAEHIAEINISLGPAGELRYPSYNSHDKGTDYPTRGALQCYSKLAKESFRQWALDKYGSLEAIDAKWGTNLAGGQALLPPSNPKQFFADSDHVDMQYGRDFFDWYAEQPMQHARLVLKGVFDILAADDSPMKGIDIGVKVPGIHWLTGRWVYDTRVTSAVLEQELAEILKQHTLENAAGTDATAFGAGLANKISDHIRMRTRNWVPEHDGGSLQLGSRLAELAAGLIRTSNIDDWGKDEAGHGYRPLIKLFAEFEGNRNNRLVMHFTCGEMADGEGAEGGAESVAATLVRWVGEEANRQGVPAKIENAVSWTLPVPQSWDHLRGHLAKDWLVNEDGVLKPRKPLKWLDQVSWDRMHRYLEHQLQWMRTRGAVVNARLGDPTSIAGGLYEGLTVLRMNHVAEDPVAKQEMANTVAYVAEEPEAQTTSTVVGPGASAVAVSKTAEGAQAPTVVEGTAASDGQPSGAVAERSQGPPAQGEKVA